MQRMAGLFLRMVQLAVRCGKTAVRCKVGGGMEERIIFVFH
jgi:hypothetical protein